VTENQGFTGKMAVKWCVTAKHILAIQLGNVCTGYHQSM